MRNDFEETQLRIFRNRRYCGPALQFAPNGYLQEPPAESKSPAERKMPSGGWRGGLEKCREIELPPAAEKCEHARCSEKQCGGWLWNRCKIRVEHAVASGALGRKGISHTRAAAGIGEAASERIRIDSIGFKKSYHWIQHQTRKPYLAKG